MPLEFGTYINSLNASNPLGTGDPKSQGDDHLRLIKSTIKNTFPNLTGAVTATHTELNYITGATGVTGTGNTVRSASPTLTGTIAAAALTLSSTLGVTGQGTFTASGAGAATAALNLSAAAPFFNWTETDQAADAQRWLAGPSAGVFHIGPCADAATSPQSAQGIHLTRSTTTCTEIQLDATTLDFNGNADISGALVVGGVSVNDAALFTTGSLADARLSSNVPLKNAANTFTNNQNLFGDGAHNEYAIGTPNLGLANDGAAVLSLRDSTNNVEAFFVAGAGTVQIGSFTNHALDLYVNNASVLSFAAGGAITPPTGTAEGVGYVGAPPNSQAGNYTLVATDRGKLIQYTGTGGHTITIPANASVAFPIGTILTFAHYGSGGTNVSIAIATDVMYLAATSFATTGTRTLAAGGMAQAVKNDATHWTISGVGLT